MTKRTCWLCESDALVIEEINNPVYFHCPNCDLIFTDDAFILDNEEEKQRYSLHKNNRENVGYVRMFERIGFEEFKSAVLG